MYETKCVDCVKAMKDLDDGSVDLIVTDPPYEFSHLGGGCFGNQHREYHGELKDITSGIKNDVLEEMLRVMKRPNAYIWCNKAQIRQYLDFFEDAGCTSDILMWHKSNPIPLGNNTYLPDTEYCLYFRKGATLYGDYHTKSKYWITPVNKEDKERYGHPTIKPLDIIETLVRNSSLEGDLILDPYMGSGTTGVACVKNGRRFIGYDIEQTYVDTANERMRYAMTQKASQRDLGNWL